MFKQLDLGDELIYRQYKIKHNGKSFNIYVDSDKLLVAMDLDDYKFDKKENFFASDTDIFGDYQSLINHGKLGSPEDWISQYVDPIEKAKLLELRTELLKSFNDKKQLENLIDNLNDTIPDWYKVAQFGITYKKFKLEY